MKKVSFTPPVALLVVILFFYYLFIVISILAGKFGSDPKTLAGVLLLFPVGLIVGGMIYQIPAYIAFKRGHSMAGFLWAVNLILGWTGLGFLGCLIWACIHTNSAEQKVIINEIPTKSLKQELAELQELHGDGLISEAEYQARRQSLLS